MSFLVNWGNLDRPAIFTDNGQAISYGQLRNNILAVANVLIEKRLIFIVGSNDISTITTYLACLERKVVPLLLSAELAINSLENLINVYNPYYLFLPKVIANKRTNLKVLIQINDYVLSYCNSGEDRELNPDLALLLTTSGSTGSPKLVRLSASNILSNTKAIIEYLDINEDERSITTLPFNYSYGLSILNSHLHAGASIVLTNRSFFDQQFWNIMKSLNITNLAGVPYTYEMLMKIRFNRMHLPFLRTLTQAGGKMPDELAKRVIDVCVEKNIRLIMMYGQTEASPRMAYLPADKSLSKLGSIGRAIPGGRLWIESEQGTEVAESNILGELIYSGPNVALGYAEIPEDLFRGNDWGGVLRTGDIAYKDDQEYFYIKGRISRFLKIFGVRISLDEIESWYYKRGISAAAYGLDDLLMVTIESEKEISQGSEVNALSSYLHIHSSAIVISCSTHLPRLSSGKLDYASLKATQ